MCFQLKNDTKVQCLKKPRKFKDKRTTIHSRESQCTALYVTVLSNHLII